MIRFCAITLILALAASTLGCQSTRGSKVRAAAPTLLVETQDVETGNVKLMPVPLVDGTLVEIPVSTFPVLTANEIARVDVVRVELGLAFMLTLTTRGQMRLMQSSGSNIGNRLILIAGERIVGLRRIDGVITDVAYFSFPIISNDELELVVEQMNAGLDRAQKR